MVNSTLFCLFFLNLSLNARKVIIVFWEYCQAKENGDIYKIDN